ncbi:MAG: copper chaperone PCu(A)C [Balneolaceae bacterium]
MNKMILIISAVFLMGIAGSCQQRSDDTPDEQLTEGEGIEVDGAWSRPAAEGRMSAAYFLITNYSNEDDVLASVESDIAQSTEVHESYEREEGMMGMREVEELEIPSQSTVRFEQGGVHIMLIQVTRRLAEGDSFELTLNFEDHGPITIEVPVQM